MIRIDQGVVSGKSFEHCFEQCNRYDAALVYEPMIKALDAAAKASVRESA